MHIFLPQFESFIVLVHFFQTQNKRLSLDLFEIASNFDSLKHKKKQKNKIGIIFTKKNRQSRARFI